MSLKTFMVITALGGLVFGLGFALFPAQMLAGSGAMADATLMHMTNLHGIGLLVLAVMAWFARNAGDSLSRRAILLGLFVYFTLAGISQGLWALTAIVNVRVWLVFALHVVGAIVSGYFAFTQRGEVKA